MPAASRLCARDSTAALSVRSMRSPNSTTSAVSPAGSTLYANMATHPNKRRPAADALVIRHRFRPFAWLGGRGLGGHEPRFDAHAAPQRVHVENRQLAGEQRS